MLLLHLGFNTICFIFQKIKKLKKNLYYVYKNYKLVENNNLL